MNGVLGEMVAVAAVPVLVAVGAGSALTGPGSGNPPPPKVLKRSRRAFVTARTGYVLGARHCSLLPCPTPPTAEDAWAAEIGPTN